MVSLMNRFRANQGKFGQNKACFGHMKCGLANLQNRQSGHLEKQSFLGKRSGNPHSEAVFKRKRRTQRIRRDVAEWVGFEPTDGCPSTDFESVPL